MAYIHWRDPAPHRHPDFEEFVLLTIERNSDKKRFVTGGFLKSIDKHGLHWVYGIDNRLDPQQFTVISYCNEMKPDT